MFLILFLLLIFQNTFSDQLDFDLSNFDKDKVVIDVQEFQLKSLNISSDIKLDKNEIIYLTDFYDGSLINSQKIIDAIFYLKLKNRFKKVSLEIENNQIDLNIESYWKLNRVAVSGFIFGKYNILQNYNIEVGDIFDYKRHIESLKRIKKYLASQGYLDVKVSSKIFKKSSDKSVNVDIKIKKNAKFFINKVLVKSDVEQALIESIFNKKLSGKRFSLSKVSKIIKKIKVQLQSYGIYASDLKLNFYKNKKYKSVLVKLNGKFKIIKNITFLGNCYFSQDQLISNLYSHDWFFSDFYSVLIVEHIKSLYKKEGFFDISIDFEESEKKLELKIKEGQRALISEIKINSNFYSEDFLIKKFFKNTLNNFYNISVVYKILDEVIDFYTSNGFCDAYILSQRVISENGVYKLYINLSEGDQKFLSSVDIKDFSKYNKKIPFGNLNKCAPFDLKIVDIQKKWLTLFFKNIGYKNFEVVPNVKINQNIVDLQWSITEKKSDFKFGKTVLRGNVKVPFSRLFQEIKYQELDSLNKEDINSTFLNLKGIDGFESVHITPSKFLTSNKSNPMILNLVNMSKFELHTRLGFQQVNNSFILNWKNRSTYKVGGTFVLRNPLSRADSLKVDADFTIFYRHFLAQYSLPWLFNIPIRTNFRFYFNKYFQPLYLGSNNKIYHISQTGGFVSFNYKLGLSSLGINFGSEALKVTQMQEKIANALDFSPFLIEKSLPFIFSEPTFLIEQVDNKINPTKGISLFAAFKGAYSTFSDNVSYARILLENSIFYPIIKNTIFAIRNRFGHIFINNLKDLLPSERFYLGGSNSVRSYEPDFAPPLGEFDDNGRIQLIPKGSKTMFNSNIELRLKLYKAFGIVLFQDFGFLSRGFFDNRYDKIITASGFGLRYFTPIGPLRFDIGWRPKRFVNDKNFAWYLTLGQSF